MVDESRLVRSTAFLAAGNKNEISRSTLRMYSSHQNTSLRRRPVNSQQRHSRQQNNEMAKKRNNINGICRSNSLRPALSGWFAFFFVLSCHVILGAAQLPSIEDLECYVPCANGYSGGEVIPTTDCMIYNVCFAGVVEGRTECGAGLVYDQEKGYCNFVSRILVTTGLLALMNNPV